MKTFLHFMLVVIIATVIAVAMFVIAAWIGFMLRPNYRDLGPMIGMGGVELGLLIIVITPLIPAKKSGFVVPVMIVGAVIAIMSMLVALAMA